MSLVSILSLVLFILLFASLFRKNTDIFSPARLFLLVWSLTIGLVELKLSKFQPAWSTYSWMMLLIALVSMLAGMFVVYVIHFGRPVRGIGSIRSLMRYYPLESNRLYRITLFLFIAYVISFIVSALVVGYLPLFTENPALARTDWGIFGFGLFVQSFPALMFLIILYFVVSQKEKKKKFVLVSVFIITFITYSFLLQRYYIVFAIFLSVIFLYYSTILLRYRNVVIITMVLFLTVFGMSFIRLSTVAANLLYYLSDMKYSVRYAWLTEPYMYIVMNVENFAHAAEKLQKFAYGLYSLDFVFALTGLKHTLYEYLRMPKYPYLITDNFNTYTMFFIYYWDYGILGLGTIPFVLGALFSNSYYAMRRKPTINNISVYAIFAFVILFSFFIPIISFLHFAFNFFVIYTITKFISFSKNNGMASGGVHAGP